MLQIQRKTLILGIFMMIAKFPYDTDYFENVIAIYFTVYFGILVQRTVLAMKRGPKINYVLSTGQALADAIAQAFRIVGCVMENLVTILFYYSLTYLCDCKERQSVLFYGSIANITLNTWNFILREFYGKPDTQY